MTASVEPPPLDKPASGTASRLWLLVVCGGPVGVLLIIFIGWRITNSLAVRRLEREARRQGDPLTLRELAGTYASIPDERNAAIPLMELWEAAEPELWRAFRAGKSRLPKRTDRYPSYSAALPFLGSDARYPSRTQPLSETSRSAAEKFLEMKARGRVAVIEALGRGECRFPIRMELGAMTLLPHLAELKEQAQIFRIESLVAADRRQNDAALDALEHMLLTADLLRDEPILISQLVRVACVVMAVDGAEYLLSRTPLLPAQLDRLQRVLDKSRLDGALRRAFVGERAFALNIFQLSGETLAVAGQSDGDDAVDPDTAAAEHRMGMTLFRLIGIESIDRRLMLETLNAAVALSEKDTPDAWKRLAEIFDEAAAKARGFPPKIFSRLLLPAMSKAGDKFAQMEARRRAGLAAIGVERYRSARGQLPRGLDEVTPEFLTNTVIDPFDAKPIRFKHRPIGYVVYSIGTDRTDDGGAERPRKGPLKTYDVTFVVER